MTSRSGGDDERNLDAFENLSLDTDTISQDRLNLSDKIRSNLFPWNGQFSPELIEALLRTYAQPHDLILDPFVGCGTVLYEAARLGFRCFGTEINPAALKMAQTYRFINVEQAARARVIKELDQGLHEALPEPFPLFTGPAIDADQGELQRALIDLSASLGDEQVRRLLDALIVLVDFYKQDLSIKKVFNTWNKLKTRVSALPFSTATVSLSHSDARALPLSESTVDFVLTSPPYINVFNYHQQYRASAEALGWNLLEVARSEIGANRKHRGNRFLTVIQYCLDMADVLLELRRVCKPGARIVFVVGRESNVRKTRFFNGEIVSALGCRCAGLTLATRQERVFKNKFGTLISEDILHFRNDPGDRQDSPDPLDIAKLTLIRAMDRAPDESKADLEAAIRDASNVGRSPMYVPIRPQATQATA